MNNDDVGGLYSGSTAGVSYPATALIDGEEQRASISVAGASTARVSKKSFNLKLSDDGYRGAEEIRLASLPGDPTLIRPLLALEVLKAAGVPASWAEPAFVYLNDRILGLYILIEKVDKDFFDRRKIRWERLYSAEGDADFGPTFEARINEAFDGKPKPANLSAMIYLRRILLIEDDDEFERRVFSILNRESVVNYMAAAQYLNHWDGFNKNLFYYQLKDSHEIHLAPWDFDLIWRRDRAGNQEAWYLNKLFLRIGNIPSIQAAIAGKISSLLSGDVSPANLSSRIDEWEAIMAEAYSSDPWLGRANGSQSADAEELKSVMLDWLSKLH